MGRLAALAGLLLVFGGGPAVAQTGSTAPPPLQSAFPNRPLKTATRILPPFVIGEGQQLTGFSADLWMAIAQRLNLRTEWIPRPTVVDLLDTVRKGDADLGIAAISITSERDRLFDFSQPIFDSGLQILVRDTSGGQAENGSSIGNFLAVVSQKGFLQLVGFMVLMTLLFAHLCWWIERRHENGMVSSRKYIPGIFYALWWSAGTLGTQVDEMPKSGLGRFVAVVWMFIGMIFLAYFTAALTTQLTVNQLQGSIKGPEDLPGKRVATVKGSTSDRYLRDRRARVMDVEKIEDAFAALQDGRAEAVVYDAPVLLYHARHDGRGKVAVVGPVFRKEAYGIVFRTTSPYRKPINNALLALKEDGTYDRIYNRWFGDAE